MDMCECVVCFMYQRESSAHPPGPALCGAVLVVVVVDVKQCVSSNRSLAPTERTARTAP